MSLCQWTMRAARGVAGVLLWLGLAVELVPGVPRAHGAAPAKAAATDASNPTGASPAPTAAGAGARWQAGPLAHQFSLGRDRGERLEVVGPVFSREESPTRSQWAFSPLLSYAVNEENESEQFDLAYPLLTYRRTAREYRWQLFQLLSLAGGGRTETNYLDRFTLYPFFFWQTSMDKSGDYWGLMPFYGDIRDRLNRDEMRWIGFPLYLQSRKKDVVTDNYLFPFFHLRRGDGLKGWQLWPLAGVENREPGWKTNAWGDAERVPGHHKEFYLWPFFLRSRVDIGGENPGTNWTMLPLFSIERSKDRDQRTFLWPFISFSENRLKKSKEWGAPWPFIGMGHGESNEMVRFWPVYGKSTRPGNTSDFLAWPLYKHQVSSSGPIQKQRTQVMLMGFSDDRQTNSATGQSRRRVDFWPLFTRSRTLDGSTRFQAPALLEPILRGNTGVERNYSPLWSFWRREFDAVENRETLSLLWNLWRSERESGTRKDSIFFGILRYQTGADDADAGWHFFRSPPPVAPPAKTPPAGASAATSAATATGNATATAAAPR